MVPRSDGKRDGDKAPPAIPSFAARVIRREQQFEAALAKCRAQALERLDAARRDAERIISSAREETEHEVEELLLRAGRKAAAEEEKLLGEGRREADELLLRGRSLLAGLVDPLVETLLPRPPEGRER